MSMDAFTSHYVSINSGSFAGSFAGSSVFTSHYVSINSTAAVNIANLEFVFTSHYVSINSGSSDRIFKFRLDLHPTMYLLIRRSYTRLV